MTSPSLILGAPDWWSVAAALLVIALLPIVWSYTRARSRIWVRVVCVC